jgi:hypothetical protein
MTTFRSLVVLTIIALGLCSPALAQDEVSGDIELGADGRGRYEGSRSSSDVRIGLQMRLDALTMLGPLDSTSGAPGFNAQSIGRRLLVPFATPGVRLIDGKLFLGAGIGLHGWSTENDDGDEASRSGFGLSPLAQFDVLSSDSAALSLGGALHIASLSETEVCPDGGDCIDQDDGGSGVGLSLGVGVRGIILPGLALGGDLGWGFVSLSYDDDSTTFIHGIYAAILLEATIGV